MGNSERKRIQLKFCFKNLQIVLSKKLKNQHRVRNKTMKFSKRLAFYFPSFYQTRYFPVFIKNFLSIFETGLDITYSIKLTSI